MKLIKNNQVLDDSWHVLRNPEIPLPEGQFIIPFSFWLEHKEKLMMSRDNLAFYLNGDDEIEVAAQHMNEVAFIALDFPAFVDGRCYSYARLLRERYAYSGELRAIGDVLRDQLFYMFRCGFNAFAIREDKNAEDALLAFKDFTIKYQTAADEAEPIYLARHR